MRRDLPVELVTQDDDVLKMVGNWILLRIPAVPDLGLMEEAEPRPLYYLRCSAEASLPKNIVAPKMRSKRPPAAGIPCPLCACRRSLTFRYIWLASAAVRCGCNLVQPNYSFVPNICGPQLCLQTSGIFRFAPGLLDREQVELRLAPAIPALSRRSSCFPAALCPPLRYQTVAQNRGAGKPDSSLAI
jgi:hypothetical protein